MPSHINKKLSNVIEWAAVMHLPQGDIDIAKEFLDSNEQGLCLDHIAVQLYEYNLPITSDFYELIGIASDAMGLKKDTYAYLKELIK